MPSPTARQSHIDTALTNISIAYTNAAYIFDQVFPMVPVQKQTNKYFIFTKADWFRSEAGVRAPGTRAPRADYTLSTSNYVCIETAVAKQVPDEVVANSDAPLQPLTTATQYATDQLMKAQEVDVLGLVFGTGWSSSATPGTLWSSDSSDPLGDIETGMNTVALAIGREPNVGVIGRGLWRYLKNHPDLLDRLKYGANPANPAAVSLAGVAALAGLQKLLVAAAVQDTAAEGATSSISFIGGNHMWLGYVAPGAAIGLPSAGYTFVWQNREVSRYREDQEHADVIEARASWDAVVTAADAGYLVKSAA